MHNKPKNNKTQTILFLLITTLALTIFIITFYTNLKQTNPTKQITPQTDPRIDLTIRPIEELFELDFADVKEEKIKDPSKCNSTRIIDEFKEQLKNKHFHPFPEESAKYLNKVKILDNCWREFENEYVKFKIIDTNDSLKIHELSDIELDLSARTNKENSISNNKNYGFIVAILPNQNKKNIALDNLKKTTRFISEKWYVNKNKTKIQRIEYKDSIQKVVSYKIFNKDYKEINIGGNSKLNLKNILTTIKLK